MIVLNTKAKTVNKENDLTDEEKNEKFQKT